MDQEKNMISKVGFLLDVFWCSLSSFGGPEAHYGVFSQILVQKKKYLNETTLSELIGVFALVPGPSSTQTIMAIGYLVGGPWLALLTFFVWAFPAILMMTIVGLFFNFFQQQTLFTSILSILPPIAVGFIAYAGYVLSKKVLHQLNDLLLFMVILGLGFFLLPLTIWAVPVLLLLAGGFMWLRQGKQLPSPKTNLHIPWFWFFLLIFFAFTNEWLLASFHHPWIQLFTSFYRYGYSVIGGGQIVIPLMIQELVTQQSLLSLHVFLSGYAIDQAIPGPLFSFAAFVGVQSLVGTPLAWLGGLLSGLMIFIPGIFLVFGVFPIYQTLRQFTWMKVALKGISIAAASLIVLTAVTQFVSLQVNLVNGLLVTVTFGLLIWKKIPTPLLVVLLLIFGLLF